jgi:hypothetical protein
MEFGKRKFNMDYVGVSNVQRCKKIHLYTKYSYSLSKSSRLFIISILEIDLSKLSFLTFVNK